MTAVRTLDTLIDHANDIAEKSTAFPANDLQRLGYEMASNSSNRLRSNRGQIQLALQIMSNEADLHMITVQINSLDFVRENLISANRIAQSSERQSQEMQEYAKESRKDTRNMRRLAFLTMCYLPTTPVATIFSMPFLSLDDALEFKAIGKLWIFLVISIFSTSLTFAISWWWDTHSNKKQEAMEATKSRDSEARTDTVPTLQGPRPKPHYDVTIRELLVKAGLIKRGRLEQDSSEDEGSTVDDAGRTVDGSAAMAE
ncbi:hypothetical protein B0T14DRAFT_556276 [Immersiella caudata]|uniref:Uncharacterized protein n=1 Tax=Immersiella caudata TaxID=314043 RepID=A0AA40BX41_9PEZI|nr:hypothetical protein B0T14DRAFT_556276 [Immersiella caudata]